MYCNTFNWVLNNFISKVSTITQFLTKIYLELFFAYDINIIIFTPSKHGQLNIFLENWTLVYDISNYFIIAINLKSINETKKDIKRKIVIENPI